MPAKFLALSRTDIASVSQLIILFYDEVWMSEPHTSRVNEMTINK